MKFKVDYRYWFLPIVLVMWQSTQPAVAENDAALDGLLTSKIDYWFVGHLGQTDDEGRLLVWEATVEGDVNGEMKWWFVNPPAIADVTFTSGSVSFYAARWELWIDGALLLAGNSAGKTVFAAGADGIWDGHGRVTEANGEFGQLHGRHIYETGPVLLGSEPPRSLKGTGAFVIY